MLNKQEAKEILKAEIRTYRSKEYSELTALIQSSLNYQKEGPSGDIYQIEIQVFWENPREVNGDIRVIAAIDDGKFPSVFIPLTLDFIMDSEGNFVGE
jgi:hypothetical protein